MDLERDLPCILTEIAPAMRSNHRAQWPLMLPQDCLYLLAAAGRPFAGIISSNCGCSHDEFSIRAFC